jgi:hypothetical protein
MCCVVLITFLARIISRGINSAFDFTFRRHAKDERWTVALRGTSHRCTVNILVKNWDRERHRAGLGSGLEQTLRWT